MEPKTTYNSCKPDTFEKCLNVCKNTGESIKNCGGLCLEGTKNLCGNKTKIILNKNQFSAETENSKKGWVLILISFIIILSFIWRFLS